MDPRTQKILEALIFDFIENGAPVSSLDLYKHHRFDIKPATIRNILAALDEAGYLAQPHTSAGRIPTDKGYQFFVERILKENEAHRELAGSLLAVIHDLLKGDLDRMVSDLSEKLGVLSIGYEPEEKTIVKSGLEALVDELIDQGEIQTLSEMRQIVHDFEMIEERMPSLVAALRPLGATAVFIGASPITKSPHLAVIADSFAIGGDRFLLAAIGSKRMDYEHNIRCFAGLKQKMAHSK